MAHCGRGKQADPARRGTAPILMQRRGLSALVLLRSTNRARAGRYIAGSTGAVHPLRRHGSHGSVAPEVAGAAGEAPSNSSDS